MIFIIHLLDRPGAAELRTQLMAQHKAYVATMADRMAFAGPLFGADGQSVVGSLLALDFEDQAAAERWLEAEPFTRGGVYAQRTIHGFENRWPQKVGFPKA